MITIDNKEYLTLPEAAEFLDMCRTTLMKTLKVSNIKIIRVGVGYKKKYVLKKDLENLFK